MRILVLICSSIIGFSAIAQDDGLSREENITLFNEAQSVLQGCDSRPMVAKGLETKRCAKDLPRDW